MPTYVALLKWSPQGLQNIKQSPSRLDAARKGFESAGVRMKEFYMVTGRYDMVAIVEAPDDVALAKAILGATSQGNITSETCRAFTEEEYRKIIGGLS
ncbi:MAG: GYD domain-containing protein [Acidobacteriaceae bacterium]|nr:GYD domain-containing protein [Acidobacteriaceae bacterium]MBV9502767.1 GYD domain-containing protein [Acidobacteriaceae bacterium]